MLDIPKILKWHPIFYVNVLKFVEDIKGFNKNKAKILSQEDMWNQTMDQIEAILDKYMNMRGIQYLYTFKDYPPHEFQWINEMNLRYI